MWVLFLIPTRLGGGLERGVRLRGCNSVVRVEPDVWGERAGLQQCNAGIIFNTRKTGVVWREGSGEDNIDTMRVLFLIPA